MSHAQEEAQKKENLASVIQPGITYEVVGSSPSGSKFTQHLFVESINQGVVKGSVVNKLGLPSCVGEVIVISGVINQDGTARLEAKAQGGCSARVWEIRQEDNLIKATVKGSLGSFPAVLNQKNNK